MFLNYTPAFFPSLVQLSASEKPLKCVGVVLLSQAHAISPTLSLSYFSPFNLLSSSLLAFPVGREPSCQHGLHFHDACAVSSSSLLLVLLPLLPPYVFSELLEC